MIPLCIHAAKCGNVTKFWPAEVRWKLLVGTLEGGMLFGSVSLTSFLLLIMNAMAHAATLEHKKHGKNGDKETYYLMMVK